MPRYTRRLIGLVLLLVLTGTSAWATGTDLKINGQVRFRATVDDRDFDRSDMQTFGELRTRIGFGLMPQENLKLFVQLQDSRLVGGNSGGLAADANVGLHQGYFKYHIGSGWYVKAGRFEMVYGDQRLMGNVGWNNVGRTWDGVRIRKNTEKLRLDFFATQLNETAFADEYPDEDNFFGGFTFRCSEKKVEAYLWTDVKRTPGEGFIDRDDIRTTVGVHSGRTFRDNFDYVCTAAYQFGSQKTVTVPDTNDVTITTELDYAAFLFSLETGYTVDDDGKIRFAALFDYASGDDNPADGELNAFNNLYYTGHKFRGYMDYFLASNSLGLIDAAFRAKFKVSDRWMVKGDAHRFWSAQGYPDSGGGSENTIGDEIDLTVAFEDGKFGFALGVSAFKAADDAHGYADNLVGGETATWRYVMCTANF